MNFLGFSSRLAVARYTVEPRLKPQNGSTEVSSISLRVIAKPRT